MPQPLRPLLAGLDIRTAQEMGWGRLKNGELLKRAEGVFDAFVTADQRTNHLSLGVPRGRNRSVLIRRLS